MTIIDELLILLDDLEEAQAEEIPQYFESQNLQVIFSSLGRLVNRGWVAKKSRRQGTYYSITLHGVNELNETLDAIKNEEPLEWDRKWHLIIFDIPETKRKLRDSFRLVLRNQGYGLLTSSVWLSPWDRSESIRRFMKRHNLQDNIFLIEATHDSYLSLRIAHRGWNWNKIDEQYREFLNRATRTLRTFTKKDSLTRFKAKKLIFEYAEIVKTDPQLPVDISPNVTMSRKARELYIKIRPFCLKEN